MLRRLVASACVLGTFFFLGCTTPSGEGAPPGANENPAGGGDTGAGGEVESTGEAEGTGAPGVSSGTAREGEDAVEPTTTPNGGEDKAPRAPELLPDGSELLPVGEVDISPVGTVTKDDVTARWRIEVATRTRSAGFEIEIRQQNESEDLAKLDTPFADFVLVGRAPEEAAAQAITEAVAQLEIELNKRIGTVIVTGRGKSSQIAEVPWPSDEIPENLEDASDGASE